MRSARLRVTGARPTAQGRKGCGCNEASRIGNLIPLSGIEQRTGTAGLPGFKRRNLRVDRRIRVRKIHGSRMPLRSSLTRPEQCRYRRSPGADRRLRDSDAVRAAVLRATRVGEHLVVPRRAEAFHQRPGHRRAEPVSSRHPRGQPALRGVPWGKGSGSRWPRRYCSAARSC